jgi:hypothetical protein
LGSGLAEPYFLSLFDEIIELTGPPAQPHFALIQAGEVDTDFLRRRYSILCHVYPTGHHDSVREFLVDLKRSINGVRYRSSQWGFSPTAAWIHRGDIGERFACVRAMPPSLEELPPNEVIAISAGRGYVESNDSAAAARGRPLLSGSGLQILGLEPVSKRNWESKWTWRGDWYVSSRYNERAFGVVARELHVNPAGSPREERSPEAIRLAFSSFLQGMAGCGVKRVHAQLLASGDKRVFQPWIALGQMALAYGELSKAGISPMDLIVRVYVVDPGLIALLEGGWLNLCPYLDVAPLTFKLETIDAGGGLERHPLIAMATARVHEVVQRSSSSAWVSVHPAPRLTSVPQPLAEVRDFTLRELGLVHGGVLVVDCRG